MKKYIFIIYIVALILTGCKTAQKASTKSPFQRKPIVEVTEDELKQDSRLIEAKTYQETGRPEKERKNV